MTRHGSAGQRTLRGTLTGVALLACLTSSALTSVHAQGGPPGTAPRGRSGAVRLDDAQRGQLERRLQERINQVVRVRLALTDDQFDKLRAVASRVEAERRTLRNEEMTTRFAMRQELLAGDKANEARVSELLERMPRFERRRLDLMEQEQRELAKFLSPTQRARYIGLQDELRRSMQDLQRRRMGIDGAPGDSLTRRTRRPPGGAF